MPAHACAIESIIISMGRKEKPTDTVAKTHAKNHAAKAIARAPWVCIASNSVYSLFGTRAKNELVRVWFVFFFAFEAQSFPIYK